jgi:ABC-type Na+ efflux pump permease subunit
MMTSERIRTRNAVSAPAIGRVNREHVRALLGADVRRLGPQLARSGAAVLALVVLALATGIGSRGLVAGLVGALLLMHPMFLALQVAKDKIDGTLEFLCTLPVTAASLALVRLVPILVLSAVAGVAAAGAALWTGMPAAMGRGVASVTLGAALLGTLVPAALAAGFLALSVRMRFETLVSLPMVLLLGLTVIGKLADRFVPPATWSALHALAAHPWMPPIALVLVGLALALVIALSFAVLARALASFTPEARGG